jgi:hypothetical protein
MMAGCKAKVIPGLNCAIKHHIMEAHGKWRYSSIILNLGSIWRREVSFRSQPLYPRGWLDATFQNSCSPLKLKALTDRPVF